MEISGFRKKNWGSDLNSNLQIFFFDKGEDRPRIWVYKLIPAYAEKLKYKKEGIHMLFFSKKTNKAGCASVGAVICGSIGYSGKKWSA